MKHLKRLALGVFWTVVAMAILSSVLGVILGIYFLASHLPWVFITLALLGFCYWMGWSAERDGPPF